METFYNLEAESVRESLMLLIKANFKGRYCTGHIGYVQIDNAEFAHKIKFEGTGELEMELDGTSLKVEMFKLNEPVSSCWFTMLSSVQPSRLKISSVHPSTLKTAFKCLLQASQRSVPKKFQHCHLLSPKRHTASLEVPIVLVTLNSGISLTETAKSNSSAGS